MQVTDPLNSLKPGKVESAFHIEYEITDDEKIGANSPNNDAFYAYLWDADKNKYTAKLMKTKDINFEDDNLTKKVTKKD